MEKLTYLASYEELHKLFHKAVGDGNSLSCNWLAVEIFGWILDKGAGRNIWVDCILAYQLPLPPIPPPFLDPSGLIKIYTNKYEQF